jgi:hypothetical protein
MPGRLLDRVTALFRRKPPTLREASGGVSRVRPAPRDAAREAEMDARPDTFVLTRIIGNDLVPRHAEGQSLANLRFILDHEPPLEGCEKRFVVNRILDDATREAVVGELTARGVGFTVIPFDWGDFGRTGYDFAPFAPGFFQSPGFVGELDEERQRALVRAYVPKNRYVMNNNGARNAALEDGRGRAKWVLPWDGNCLVTEGGWAEIRAAIKAAKGARYLIVPMARITDNAQLLEPGFRPEAAEEPQVVFRADAEEAFDERQVYGRRPKVELFCRLGVEGPWDNWRLDPWDVPPRPVSPEAYRVARGGWVARLFSGQAKAETADTGGFLKRGRLREVAIMRTIDRADGLFLLRQGFGADAPALYDPGRIAVAVESPGWREAVLARATEPLARQPFSVLDKTAVGPSGDPHDYWHPAPYWWPDPRKADGLPYVKKDGERVPGTRLFEAGHEAYDRTRLQWLFEDTTHLAMAWRATGEARFRERALGNLRTWFCDPATRMTPSLAYAQVRMGHDGNRGQSFGIIEGKDFYFLLDAVRLLGPSAEADGLREWLRAYLRWLVESPQGQVEVRARNNHGVAYDLHVAAVAAFLGEAEALVEVRRRAISRLRDHVAPDGRQPHEMDRTLTQHYTAFNLQVWLDLMALFERVGFVAWAPEDTGLLRRAADWVLAESEKGWRHPQIQPFDARRLDPIRAALGIVPVDPRAVPVVFHPDDGVPPYWELVAPAGWRG